MSSSLIPSMVCMCIKPVGIVIDAWRTGVVGIKSVLGIDR